MLTSYSCIHSDERQGMTAPEQDCFGCSQEKMQGRPS